MERYVWELSRAQSELGIEVHVLCERCHGKPLGNIRAYQLGQGPRKPRWLSALLFSNKVTSWINKHPQPGTVIHSHETTAVHHITTFHGPPFARIRQYPWWKRISLRVYANLWLEERELCGDQVQMVTPNSAIIAQELLRAYPSIKARLTHPVIPGVGKMKERPDRIIPSDGGVIGFIGKEWHRKGLDRVIAIVSELRKTRPNCELWVAGPAPEDIAHLFKNWDRGFQLLGLTDAQKIMPQLDLLLHPARREPFGMVITEALAAKIPAVVSSECGAASEIGELQGTVLDESESIDSWAKACHTLLSRQTTSPPYQHSWKKVATEYTELYRAISTD